MVYSFQDELLKVNHMIRLFPLVIFFLDSVELIEDMIEIALLVDTFELPIRKDRLPQQNTMQLLKM